MIPHFISSFLLCAHPSIRPPDSATAIRSLSRHERNPAAIPSPLDRLLLCRLFCRRLDTPTARLLRFDTPHHPIACCRRPATCYRKGSPWSHRYYSLQLWKHHLSSRCSSSNHRRSIALLAVPMDEAARPPRHRARRKAQREVTWPRIRPI